MHTRALFLVVFFFTLSSVASAEIGSSIAAARADSMIAPEQVDAISSWTGTYSVSEPCNGTTIGSSGPVTVVLVETSEIDFLFMTFSDVALFDDFDCVVVLRDRVAVPFGVTISGNTITSLPSEDPEDEFNLSATISGSSMSGSFGDGEVSASFNVQRSSTGIGPITGNYSGSYTIAADCDNGQSVQAGGDLSMSLFHSGTNLGGFASFELTVLDSGSCQSHAVMPVTFGVGGTTSGSSVEAFIAWGTFMSLSGSSSGSTISGTISGDQLSLGETPITGTFSLTRGSGGEAAVIDSFTANPSTIRRGESTSLIWSTTGATSVTIEPGLGSHPPAGAITVSPETTTTYTLSAVGTSGTVTRQTVVTVITTPEVVLVALPEPLAQGTNAGGATTRFILRNVGGEATSITLEQEGNFFTQSPGTFTLGPGESQQVTVTGLQQTTGSYRGASIPFGAGVPQGLEVPIQLLSVPAPDGPTAAEPESNRIDITAPVGSSPTGTATFRNTGEAKIQGTLDSTVPWIIPQSGLIEVDPGESVTVSFTIDRSRRPANADVGSLEGRLVLVFRSGPAGKAGGMEPRDGASVSTSLVTVVDTSKPEVEEGAVPPLSPGEVALFIPGAGHVQGGTGLFFSDISLVNVSGRETLNEIDLYYTPSTPGASSKKATVSGLMAGTPLALADVVRTVFEEPATLGSLQVRSADIGELSVNANILLRTREENERTFGNTIPVLRSDRSLGSGESFFLTGLTKTSTSHTNLFIQETSGGQVTVDIEFFDEGGVTLGARNGIVVAPFQLFGLFESATSPVLPLGAVSAVITSRGDSAGRFAAYATPVDKVSGDSWSLVDWNAQSAFSGTSEMVIPVAGALRGANNLNFRTDVAVINRGATQASGVLRYIPRPGENRAPMDRTITLGARQSAVLEDVTTSLFGLDPTQFTLGYMKFLPDTGTMTVTSRNFATQGDDPGTFGTGVATSALDTSLRVGDVLRIGGVRDATAESIGRKVPGSFRSNFGMMETTGEATVTIRVTVHFSFSTGTAAAARGAASREYTLQPNEFVQLTRVSREILGASRDDYGDFDNLQVDFAVIGGDGAATVFVSSVENDTGDSILRVE
ncbi:MAG: hypothetical protein KY432_00175 [Acidobacteria bacterium]|nr:hypothetical protein [Acidobacteriota bacterium]